MSVIDLVRDERREFADTADRVGPEHPTLRGDWRAGDLVAHLVIRDRRPDAGRGIVVPGWSWWTAHVQDRLATDDFAQNVAVVRSGPPWFVPAAYPPLDRIDLLEYAVHHEDVRRAVPGWVPRAPSPARDEQLWTILAMAGPSAYLRSEVGVVLRRSDDGRERVVHLGRRRVTITGEVLELVLHALGRDECELDFEGDADDVRAVQALARGI